MKRRKYKRERNTGIWERKLLRKIYGGKRGEGSVKEEKCTLASSVLYTTIWKPKSISTFVFFKSFLFHVDKRNFVISQLTNIYCFTLIIKSVHTGNE